MTAQTWLSDGYYLDEDNAFKGGQSTARMSLQDFSPWLGDADAKAIFAAAIAEADARNNLTGDRMIIDGGGLTWPVASQVYVAERKHLF